MNILVITQYYYPEDFRINDICEELVRRGNDVTVLTGIPNYPSGKVFAGYEKSYLNEEVYNGVRIIRCHNRPRGRGNLGLLLNYYTYVAEAKKILKKFKKKFDLIYAYQMSPISLVIPAIKYKKRFNIPLYIYVCDIWPESMRDIGRKKQLSTSNPIYLYFKHLSKIIYNSADVLGVKCNEFIDYLEKTCHVDRKKCFLNYEHAEENYLLVNEKPFDNGILDFMYLGNMGHSSNCELIIRAASKLRGDGYRIHFVGDGSEYDNLVKLTKTLNLEEKIVFHGKVSQSKVIDYYNLADVCLLTLSGKSLIGLTPPAKLTGYMAASRPIIAAANGATQYIVKNAKCGLVCNADSLDDFANLIQGVIDNHDNILNCGENGREYFKTHFTLEKHIDELEKEFKYLLKV